MSPTLETNDAHGGRRQLTKHSEANLPGENGGRATVRVLRIHGKKQKQQERHECDTPDNNGAICNSQQTTTFATYSLSLIGQLLIVIVSSLVRLLINLACRLLFEGNDQRGVSRRRNREDDHSAKWQSVAMCQRRQQAEAVETDLLSNNRGNNGDSLTNERVGNSNGDAKNNKHDNSTTGGLLGLGESRHETAIASRETVAAAPVERDQSVDKCDAIPVSLPISEMTAVATPNMKHKSTVNLQMDREPSTVSAKVVACFEHQTIANELSDQVIREALEAICQLQQEDTNMSASSDSRAEARNESVIDFEQDNGDGIEASSEEKPEEICQKIMPQNREISNREPSENVASHNDQEQEQQQQFHPARPLVDSQAGLPTPSPPPLIEETSVQLPVGSLGAGHQTETEHASSGDGSGELNNSLPDESVSSVSVSSYDDFCGQQASEINLRQLKMSALEDVLVCGKNRHSTESARRLFHMLTSSSPADGEQEPRQLDQHLRVKKVSGNRKLMASSLSSHSSRADDEEEYYEEDENEQEDRRNNNDKNNGSGFYEDIYATQDGNDDNYGTIKIIRRQCCGSANSNWSSTGPTSNGCNYGRTLVCSVSPVSQLARSASSTSSTSSSTNKWRHQLHNEGQERDQDYVGPYGIDDDEIRHCREAFRENRRLIEQVQAIAVKQRFGGDQQQGSEESSNGVTSTPGLSRSSSQATLQSRLTDRPRWTDSLNRRQQLPKCSHCQKKLYPMDRMELDFTRATLNIHRNCFKCHVCSTLLRLETYASIDTKLYCPAHTKSATITTTQLTPSTVPLPTTSLTAS